MKTLALLLALALPAVAAHATTRTSASYTILTDTADAGGKRTTSAAYTNDGSAGGVAGLSTVSAPAELVKGGYVAQLYEVVGLTLSASPATVSENTTRQLAAASVLDDLTLLTLAPGTVAWSVVSGPLTSVSSAGLATATTVYQDTSATARGTLGGFTSTVSLLVLNSNPDNFGSYAGDGIDDAWQVQFFGQPPNANAAPNVDFDGTGQTNLFKYLAGLNPLDGSCFTLSVTPVPGQAGQKSLTFNPVVSGRTYTITATSSLTSGSYSPISASAPSDNGTRRTVTDLNASGPQKFYRVEITKP